jgi:hypothetical protein
MGSNAKKKTTMSKLNREHRLRERRMDKEARKDARKRAEADGTTETAETAESAFDMTHLDRVSVGSEIE